MEIVTFTCCIHVSYTCCIYMLYKCCINVVIHVIYMLYKCYIQHSIQPQTHSPLGVYVSYIKTPHYISTHALPPLPYNSAACLPPPQKGIRDLGEERHIPRHPGPRGLGGHQGSGYPGFLRGRPPLGPRSQVPRRPTVYLLLHCPRAVQQHQGQSSSASVCAGVVLLLIVEQCIWHRLSLQYFY